MIIKALFIMRHHQVDPELLAAWDEYTIDDNPDGWKSAQERALAAVGNDVWQHAVVNIQVDDTDLRSAFQPKIAGHVTFTHEARSPWATK